MMKDNLLIADTNNHCIRKFRFSDNLISVVSIVRYAIVIAKTV